MSVVMSERLKMTTVLFAAFLLVLAGLGSAARFKERCCPHIGCFNNNYPFDNLPMPKCEDDIQVALRLFTREDSVVGQTLTRTTIPPLYEKGKPVVFTTHGYMNWREIYWLENQKNAMLEKYDFNVVTVGWAGGSWNIDYTQSASNTRVVGAVIGLAAENLVERGGAERSQLWCIGHSLGSHVCGHAGKTYKFGRVTGLDPAGPWFEDKDWTIGINPTVADFVDCWHTHGDSNILTAAGTLKRLGHVDFYPNGGGFQPGCILDTYVNTTSVHSFREKFVDLMPMCSHMRAVELFEEAISSECQMYGTHFCNDESNIPLSCFPCDGGKCGVMGMDAHLWDRDELTSRQYMTTNEKKPFCQNNGQTLH